MIKPEQQTILQIMHKYSNTDMKKLLGGVNSCQIACQIFGVFIPCTKTREPRPSSRPKKKKLPHTVHQNSTNSAVRGLRTIHIRYQGQQPL